MIHYHSGFSSTLSLSKNQGCHFFLLVKRTKWDGKKKQQQKMENGVKRKKENPTIVTNTRVFSEISGWFYVLSMIQYLWARGNISQNNVGLFTCEMHILVVITLLDFWKPHLKLPCSHGQRLPVLTEWAELRLPLWMAFLNSLHHSACIPAISRKLEIGSTVEWGSAAVPTLFYHQTASKCY